MGLFCIFCIFNFKHGLTNPCRRMTADWLSKKIPRRNRKHFPILSDGYFPVLKPKSPPKAAKAVFMQWASGSKNCENWSWYFYSEVTPCVHWSATKLPFYWVTCCWSDAAGTSGSSETPQVPMQPMWNLQMVPMPMSSQCRDRRCRQRGAIWAIAWQQDKNNRSRVGPHQQKKWDCALNHESQFPICQKWVSSGWVEQLFPYCKWNINKWFAALLSQQKPFIK